MNQSTRGKVMSWAGVDEICEHDGCDKLASWRARHKSGHIIAAACAEHKESVRDALIAKLTAPAPACECDPAHSEGHYDYCPRSIERQNV